MKNKKNQFDIISIGSAIKDIFILANDLKRRGKLMHPFDPANIGKKINIKHLYFDIGGGGTNTAAAFANFGLNTGLISQVGHDINGQEIIKTMKKIGVNTDQISIANQPTGYSVIFLNSDGERTALTFRGASDFNQFKLKSIPLRSDWLFITTLNGNVKLLKQIFSQAQKNNIKIAWNPGISELKLKSAALKPWLKQIDVLILNIKEAQLLAKTKLNQIKPLFHKLSGLSSNAIMAITAGAQGAWVKTPTSPAICQAAALPGKVINTTGAGDAFGAGLVAGLILYSNDLKKSLALAMLNSGGVVAKMGAKHGLLTKPPALAKLKQVKIDLI